MTTELRQPKVVGDILSGHKKQTNGAHGIRLGDLRELHTLQADGRKTGFLVGGLALVGVGLYVLADYLNHALCCD